MTEELETRIARLEAIEAVKRLKARYFNACDEKDADTVEDCFVERGALIDGGPAIGRFENREDFVAVFRKFGCRDNIVDMHHGANPEIEIVSDSEAEGLWALYFYSMDTDAGTFRQLAGTYRDRYVKTDRGWKIQESIFVPSSIVDGKLGDGGAVSIAQQPDG